MSSLGVRGCPDTTSQLDMSTCTDYPISSGGFGDIFRCKLKVRKEVAIKIVRLYVDSSDQAKRRLKIGTPCRRELEA